MDHWPFEVVQLNRCRSTQCFKKCLVSNRYAAHQSRAFKFVDYGLAAALVLPVATVAKSPLAASEAARIAFGPRSTTLVIIIALFSLFSILNAYMLIPSRILFGLSRDGFFIKRGELVNKGGTPYFSLIVCYAIAFVLILFSSFEQLFALAAMMMTIVTGFSFASLIWLRKKEPALPRPYKAWGYPFSTWLALPITIALFIGFAFSDRESLLIVTGLNIVSYPCYRILVKHPTKLEST